MNNLFVCSLKKRNISLKFHKSKSNKYRSTKYRNIKQKMDQFKLFKIKIKCPSTTSNKVVNILSLAFKTKLTIL